MLYYLNLQGTGAPPPGPLLHASVRRLTALALAVGNDPVVDAVAEPLTMSSIPLADLDAALRLLQSAGPEELNDPLAGAAG